MSNSPSTREIESTTATYILSGLKDAANGAVWDEYIQRYRPLLLNYGKRLGLSDEDAEDAAQHTLIEFCTAYRGGKYDRDKGRLRDWLFGIARNQVHNWQRRRRDRERQAPDNASQTDFFARISDDGELQQAWEQEWRDAVMKRSLEQIQQEVQPQTFEAFELFACQDMPAQQVAAKLGMTENAVFGAKRRVLRRLREVLAYWENSL